MVQLFIMNRYRKEAYCSGGSTLRFSVVRFRKRDLINSTKGSEHDAQSKFMRTANVEELTRRDGSSGERCGENASWQCSEYRPYSIKCKKSK